MSVLGAALITFFGFALLCTHFGRSGMCKLVGYAVFIDFAMHGSVLAMFIGTSTLGLMQAELSAVMFTVALRSWRYFIGYSRLERRGYRFVWKTYGPTRFKRAAQEGV